MHHLNVAKLIPVYVSFKEKIMNNSPATTNRVPRCFALRTQTAAHDAFISAPAQIDNGDEALYSDNSGTYTKAILHVDGVLDDHQSYQTLHKALICFNTAHIL